MAIIVEDGTGLSTAQTYVDVAYFTAWANERGLFDVSWTDAIIEPALVIAAKDWIDGEHEFAGDQVTTTQALDFPRDEWDGVPVDIKQANAYAGYLQLKGLLQVDLAGISTAGQVESESKSVGTLKKSTTYARNTAQIYSRVLPKQLNNLLKPYLAIDGGLGRVYRR